MAYYGLENGGFDADKNVSGRCSKIRTRFNFPETDSIGQSYIFFFFKGQKAKSVAIAFIDHTASYLGEVDRGGGGGFGAWPQEISLLTV
jgi:hypothetical protein